jgi:hypothetical protein
MGIACPDFEVSLSRVWSGFGAISSLSALGKTATQNVILRFDESIVLRQSLPLLHVKVEILPFL